jgi:hypothetical protein
VVGWWRATEEGLELTVRAVPNARRSGVVGVGGDGHLRVRVAAPAVDGKANDELRRVVARLFGVRESAVTIVRGEQSRTKQLRVVGVEAPPPELLDE